MRLPIFLPLLVLAVVVLVACGEEATPTLLPTATPVPQIDEVSFTVIDFDCKGPDSIPADITRMSLTNEGEDLHHHQLIKLPDGMAPEDLLAAFAEGPGLVATRD